jgi:hypothetical protein
MRLCSSTPVSRDIQRRVGIVTSSTASPDMLVSLFGSKPFLFSFSPRDQVRYARPWSCSQDRLWVALSRIPYPAGVALVLHDFASKCVCLVVVQRIPNTASRAQSFVVVRLHFLHCFPGMLQFGACRGEGIPVSLCHQARAVMVREELGVIVHALMICDYGKAVSELRCMCEIASLSRVSRLDHSC